MFAYAFWARTRPSTTRSKRAVDDVPLFSDDTRIASMFTALNLVANDLQIIVLTCRQKSFEGLGGNLLTGQSWPEI